MAGLHVDALEDGTAARHRRTQPRDPFRRFPIGHARIREPAEREDRRIVLGRHVLVGRVRQDRPERGLALGGVAPFGPFGRGQRQLAVEHGVEHVDEGHVGDDRGEEFGREIGHRPHQHAPRAAAMGDDAPLRGVAGLDQRMAAGDEIRKGVGLLLALAVHVPAPSLLGAASHMGDGVDEAAVDEREQVGAEGGRHQRAVGAVAVEQERRGAVQGQVAPVQERDRHRLPVRRRGEEAARDVILRSVAARHDLALAELPGAGDAIVVVGLGRRRHRRVGEADHRRFELVARLQAQRIGLLRESDRVLGAREVAHDDARARVLDLEPDEVAGDEVLVADHDAGTVRDHVDPVLAARGRDGAARDLEVLRSLGIGEQEEVGAPMLHRVDQQRHPLLNHGEDGMGGMPVEEMDFRRLVVARGHGEVGAGLGLVDVDEEARIALLVDQRVVVLRRADAVAHDPGRAMVIVHRRVVERGAVGGPDHLAGRRLDAVGEVLAG